MTRSGYSDAGEMDMWNLIRWRGAVASAVRGKRGQDMLREMLTAMDAMPNKRLITDDIVDDTGEVCALGTVARARGMEMMDMDPDDPTQLARMFGQSEALIREVEFINDEDGMYDETPEARFRRVRAWIVRKLLP